MVNQNKPERPAMLFV